MWIPDGLLSFEWLVFGWALAVVLFGICVRYAPWNALRLMPWRWNLVLAAAVWLILLWHVRAPVLPGISLHLWGITLVTMLLGWPLTLIVGFFVLSFDAVVNHAVWSLPWVWLATVLPAAAMTEGVHRLAVRWLPPNIFIFVFVEAFFAAMVALAVTAAAVVVLWSLLRVYPFEALVASYLPFLPLQAVPEGMVNGIALLGLALLYPEWLYGFDESRFMSKSDGADKAD